MGRNEAFRSLVAVAGEVKRRIFSNTSAQRADRKTSITVHGLSQWPPHVRSTTEIQFVRGGRYRDDHLEQHGTLVYRNPISGEIVGYR